MYYDILWDNGPPFLSDNADRIFRMAPRRSTSAGRDKASTTNKRNCKKFVIQHKFNTKFNINFGNAKWLEKCVFYDYDFSKYAEDSFSINVFV